MTIRDNGDYIRVLLDSDYTTIAGWGGSSKGWCWGLKGEGSAIGVGV